MTDLPDDIDLGKIAKGLSKAPKLTPRVLPMRKDEQKKIALKRLIEKQVKDEKLYCKLIGFSTWKKLSREYTNSNALKIVQKYFKSLIAKQIVQEKKEIRIQELLLARKLSAVFGSVLEFKINRVKYSCLKRMIGLIGEKVNHHCLTI